MNKGYVSINGCGLNPSPYCSLYLRAVMTMIMTMTRTTITIMIALKSANRDFLQSPHCAANCFQRVRSSGHVCKSRATHRALVTHNVCHVVRRNSSTIRFGRVEIAFILALFYWLKPLTHEGEGEEETGVPGEKEQTNKQTTTTTTKPKASENVTH